MVFHGFSTTPSSNSFSIGGMSDAGIIKEEYVNMYGMILVTMGGSHLFILVFLLSRFDMHQLHDDLLLKGSAMAACCSTRAGRRLGPGR